MTQPAPATDLPEHVGFALADAAHTAEALLAADNEFTFTGPPVALDEHTVLLRGRFGMSDERDLDITVAFAASPDASRSPEPIT